MAKKRKFKILIIIRNILYFLLLLLVLFSIFVKKEFYNVSFEQLLFSTFNTTGANYEIVWRGFKFIFGWSFFIVLIMFVIKKIYNYLKIAVIFKFKIKGKKIKKEFKFNLFEMTLVRHIILFVLIMIVGIYSSISLINLDSYIKAQLKNTEFFERYYVNPKKVDVEFPNKKRNLIYIYVESLESSVASIENGGQFVESYIPKLEELGLKYTNFSASEKLGGAVSVENTTWTMAALVSQTSGVPLKIPIHGNNYKGYSSSLPGAYSLGQILEENGYSNYFIMGSDADFAGRKDYFMQHGNYQIYDYYYAIEEGFINKNYHQWWGFEDQKLFEYAKQKLLKIAEKDEPFNFTMLTTDTHFIDGYLDSTCEEKFDVAYANAFYCSDSKIYEFINWIQEQDFYENTTIVVVGDHLTMQENFYPNADMSSRYVYNLFINSAIKKVDEKNRLFSVFDLYPTTLASMGVKIEGDRLGLGVNLYSNKNTLIEELGIEKLNSEIVNKSEFYNNNILGNSYIEMLEDVEEIAAQNTQASK